jgi:hypothetical protein
VFVFARRIGKRTIKNLASIRNPLPGFGSVVIAGPIAEIDQ